MQNNKTKHSTKRAKCGLIKAAFCVFSLFAGVQMCLRLAEAETKWYVVPAITLAAAGAVFALRKTKPLAAVLDFLSARLNDLAAACGIILCIAAADMIYSLCGLAPEERIFTGEREKASVIEIDDSRMMRRGPLAMGEQKLRVRVLTGKFKDTELVATNLLKSQMELDTIYAKGDTILISVLEHESPSGETEILANALNHYRTHYEIALFALFAILLFAFGGLTGIKAFLTFIFTFSVIWQLMIPLCLRGWNPVAVSLCAVSILSAVIIFAVAGFNRKGSTAFLGAFFGVLASCLMTMIFTDLLQVNGNVQPRSQALFFAGYNYLDMTKLFIGAVFLASSGAVMDLAMDVAAGMRELALHKPDITRRELLASGLRIGRAVVGTMTTTLLLAYAGGFLTLMMSFAAEKVPVADIMNYPYVVPETVKTLVGSIGLVLVAPFTALAGCLIIKPNRSTGCVENP